MVNYTNKEHMTKFNATSTTDGIKDGTSAIHTGIVKVLEQAARGNHIVEYGNLQQTAGSTYTQFGFDGAVLFLRDGLKVSVSPSAIELSAAPDGTHDRYDMLVIQAAGTLAFRNGVAGAAPQVLTTPLTAGDIPVALVKVEGGTGNNITSREIQQYGYNKDTNAVSIAYNGGGTTYTETCSIVGAAAGTTITNTVGDLILNNTDTNDQIIMKLGTVTSATSFEVKDSADQIQFKVQGDGEVSTEGSITVGSNIIKASDGGSTITMDTSDNVSIAGDLTIAGDDIIIGGSDDATDKTILFRHDAAASIIGIDDTHDRFIINTDATFDSTALDNDFAIDVSGNCYIKGDLTVTGNDLTFGNGATIVNTTSSLLTITEATTAFSAAVTAGTSVAAPTITASTQLTTSERLSRGGEQTADSNAAFPLATPLTYKSVQLLDTIAGPTNFFVLPTAAANAGAIITLKNLGATQAEIELNPALAQNIDGGGLQSSLIAAPNIISLPSMAHVTIMAYDDGIINQGALGGTVASGCIFTTGWVIIGQGL